MLSIVGIGLSDEKDITVRGLEAVRSSDLVFLEAYTSVISAPKETLVCVEDERFFLNSFF